jgi:uncharacterized protein (TIGR00661 family)
MTQALALKRLLEDAGHEVVAAFMGEKPDHPLPAFFESGFAAPIHKYLSPTFVVDRSGKGVRPWESFFQAIGRSPRYWREAPRLHRLFLGYRPDLVVNFFDLIGGFYSAIYRPKAPVVAVGHQFLFFHPEFKTPKEERFQVAMTKNFVRLTSLGARLRLALSFTPMAHLPDRRVRVVPPLLRTDVLDATPTRGPHFLAYVLNPGYAQELMAWHKTRPDIELHCFWDRQDVEPTHSPWRGLTFHRLDARKFLDLLISCRGFASTAGFESVCEAAFLDKPITVVPTGNHVEQLCNALDAERAGLVEWRRDFDLSGLQERSEDGETLSRDAFQRWVSQAPDLFLGLIEEVACGRDPFRLRPSSSFPRPGPINK